MLLLFSWILAFLACACPISALPPLTDSDAALVANLTDANMFNYESAVLVRIGELSSACRDLRILRVELTSTIGDVTSYVSTSINLFIYSRATKTIYETSTLATVPVRWSDPTLRKVPLGDNLLWTWYQAPAVHILPAIQLARQQGYAGPWKKMKLQRLGRPPPNIPSGFTYEFDRDGQRQHVVMAAYTGTVVSWQANGLSENDATAALGQNSSTPASS